MLLGHFAAAAPAFAGEVVFDALAVTVDGTKYTFSRAPATSKEPVVIKAEGRPLTAADRKHRVDLQKTWISKNVPKAYVFRLRALQECEFKREDEFNACDVYHFEDPKSGRQISYYIYVGNWP